MLFFVIFLSVILSFPDFNLANEKSDLQFDTMIHDTCNITISNNLIYHHFIYKLWIFYACEAKNYSKNIDNRNVSSDSNCIISSVYETGTNFIIERRKQ